MRSVGDLDEQETNCQVSYQNERDCAQDRKRASSDEQEDERDKRSSGEDERQNEVKLPVAVDSQECLMKFRQ